MPWFGRVVNNDGMIEAQTLQNQGGQIRLLGDMQNGVVQVGGTLDASAPNGGNGGSSRLRRRRSKSPTARSSRPRRLRAVDGTWLIDPTDFTIAASRRGHFR